MHDLRNDLDAADVYSSADIGLVVREFLAADDRTTIDPVLDSCVARYRDELELDEDEEVALMGKAKAFCRT